MKNTSNILNLLHTKNIIIGILIFFGFIASGEISGQTSSNISPPILEKDFYKGTAIRVTFLKENIVRIQIAPHGSKYNESGLNRYGFIQDINSDNLKVDISESKNGFSLETSRLIIKGNSSTGKIVVTYPGRLVV